MLERARARSNTHTCRTTEINILTMYRRYIEVTSLSEQVGKVYV